MRMSLLFPNIGAMLIAFWIGAASAQSYTPIPLTDHGERGTFFGLYDASNLVPPDHDAVGRVRAAEVRPLDRDGSPAADGKIVLLSIGMSNTSLEWCGISLDCVSPVGSSLMGLAAGNGDVNHSTLAIVNGADAGLGASAWTLPVAFAYDRVRDLRLAPEGLTEKQVQVVWLKNANPFPMIGLPSADADAYVLDSEMGSTVRALRVRYPNLKMVFLSSRIYAGYSPATGLNPEPYAYESGFAVKWLIAAQIAQMRRGGLPVDARAGDLNYNTVAPWIAWGPYLWANGMIARSDGLIWSPADFTWDETHVSPAGIAKVGDMLMDFFTASPYTRCWFTAAGCGTPSPSHDVAMTTMTAPASVKIGASATVSVTVKNTGAFIETFAVMLTDSASGKSFGQRIVSSLSAGATQTLNFAWGARLPTEFGPHGLTATAVAVQGETNTTDNALSVVVNVTP